MDPLEAENNMNAGTKEQIEAVHAEKLVDEPQKHEAPTLTRAQIRRFMLQVDLHVLPILGTIYAVSIIDRINIGSAKVLGMAEDLNLGKGERYSVILMLFFPGYCLSDVPSNWILTKVQPRLWLSFLTFSWGAVLCGMGFVHNWQVMVFLRFLLGLFEGGVLPGITVSSHPFQVHNERRVLHFSCSLVHADVVNSSQFTISCWYDRKELHKRISGAYGFGIIASALAGILSYGLGQLDGVRDMRGWRWIFSIEGGFSMALGLVAILFIPKFPDRTKWIKPDQRVYLYNKLKEDRGEYKTGEVNWNSFVQTSKDWTLWAQGTIYCFTVGTANAVAFFSPTIINVSIGVQVYNY